MGDEPQWSSLGMSLAEMIRKWPVEGRAYATVGKIDDGRYMAAIAKRHGNQMTVLTVQAHPKRRVVDEWAKKTLVTKPWETRQ